MGRENTFVYQENLTGSAHSSVITNDRTRLQLNLEWKNARTNQERFQTFPLPSLFNSFDQLKSRDLGVDWVNGTSSKDTLVSLLEGLSVYISLKYPGFWIVAPIKTYEERPHGEPDESSYRMVSIASLLNEIGEQAMLTQQKTSQKWTGGFSNMIFIAPDSTFTYDIGEHPSYPQNDGLPSQLILPAIDLDIDSTGDPKQDLLYVGTILAAHGFSGWLIKSGEGEKGGYHYLADFVMPYSPFMWQSLGKLMNILTPFHSADLKTMAEQIQTAQTLREAKMLADQLLSLEHIRERSFPYSFADLRHPSHSIRDDEMVILRSLPAKNYSTSPQVVAEIK